MYVYAGVSLIYVCVYAGVSLINVIKLKRKFAHPRFLEGARPYSPSRQAAITGQWNPSGRLDFSAGSDP